MGSNDPTDREDIALSTSELDDVLSSADIRSESGNDEESGLEKYGIWIKVEPETLEAAAETESDFALADLDSGPAPGARLTAEEEQLLGELESETDEPLGAGAEQAAGETADFEGLEKDLLELDASGGEAEEDEDLTVADLDLDLDELALEQGKEPEIEVPLSDSIPELDSLEEAAETEARGADARSSEAILKKIEQDLKQIKLEIQNLKKELAGRRGPAEVEVPHAAAAPGFFAEEEDDSIALTGDELDNILNTADITEEQAGGPGPEQDLEEAAPAEAVEDLDLLEPGSLSAEPEEIEIELDQKPSGGSADLDLGALDEELSTTPADELELEELSLEDFSGEAAAEPAAELDALELETLAEAEPASEEPLEAMEELPDLSLADEQLMPETGEEAAAEPVELELMEEAEMGEPVAELEGEPPSARPAAQEGALPEDLREDVKSVLSYLDQLLEALPDEKIQQFAQSEYFGVYKRLFEELGLGA
jgi:hypothetical protein